MAAPLAKRAESACTRHESARTATGLAGPVTASPGRQRLLQEFFRKRVDRMTAMTEKRNPVLDLKENVDDPVPVGTDLCTGHRAAACASGRQ